MLLADGDARARLVVDVWSAPRPGEAFDPASPEESPAPFDPEGCAIAPRYEGRVFLESEELSPLTLTASEGAPHRIELFDARAETLEGFELACGTGTLDAAGARTRYRGRLGPRGGAIVGRAEIDGEAGLFWLVAAPPDSNE